MCVAEGKRKIVPALFIGTVAKNKFFLLNFRKQVE